MKLILGMSDGSKMWINPCQILKMIKTYDGHYYLYLTNGEMFEIDSRTASIAENCMEKD